MAFRPPRSDAKSGDSFARYGSLGLHFVATLLVFGLVGAWIDRWLQTFPLLFVIGLLAGGVGAMISIVRKVPPPRGSTRSRSPHQNSDRP